MCNYLTEDSEKIRDKGFGWKVFTSNFEQPNHYGTWVSSGDTLYRNKDKDGWITWDEAVTNRTNIGFCFIPTKKESTKFNLDQRDIIKKIEFRQGLAKHICHRTLGGKQPIEVAICKQFRIIKKEKK